MPGRVPELARLQQEWRLDSQAGSRMPVNRRTGQTMKGSPRSDGGEGLPSPHDHSCKSGEARLRDRRATPGQFGPDDLEIVDLGLLGLNDALSNGADLLTRCLLERGF